jgi:hypothetical protein
MADHEQRARRMIEMLGQAIDSLGTDGRRHGEQIIDGFWRSLGGIPDGDPRIVAIVEALENARVFWQSPLFHETMGQRSPAEKRRVLLVLASVQFAGLAPVVPDQGALALAIEMWPEKGSHARWPAVRALAESIGACRGRTGNDADDRRALETLKQAIERHLERREAAIELLARSAEESSK